MPTATLVLVGDGQLRRALSDTARGLGIAGAVHFPGYQQRDGAPCAGCRPSTSCGCWGRGTTWAGRAAVQGRASRARVVVVSRAGSGLGRCGASRPRRPRRSPDVALRRSAADRVLPASADVARRHRRAHSTGKRELRGMSTWLEALFSPGQPESTGRRWLLAPLGLAEAAFRAGVASAPWLTPGAGRGRRGWRASASSRWGIWWWAAPARRRGACARRATAWMRVSRWPSSAGGTAAARRATSSSRVRRGPHSGGIRRRARDARPEPSRRPGLGRVDRIRLARLAQGAGRPWPSSTMASRPAG